MNYENNFKKLPTNEVRQLLLRAIKLVNVALDKRTIMREFSKTDEEKQLIYTQYSWEAASYYEIYLEALIYLNESKPKEIDRIRARIQELRDLINV